MYLKAIEIQGFKSFPEKTVLTFDKNITAIVGPNGSGKSNISDAMLWVMGEQRSKSLRGGKMEDVIFGGTEKRAPLGFAQVSLTLDNSANTFAIDAAEVTLTRRYYRTGESEYYINHEAVRLRDINELLMDTGLGRDGYSVIGQGRIAEIVSARSADRREIFEEAAGISRFRYRKEEAERKLDRTEENLLRINDKIDELELQVVPLKKQAETAKKYLLLRDELRTLEISVWMETLDKLHSQSALLETEFQQASEALKHAEAELADIYAATENFAERMRDCDVASEQLRERIREDEAAISEKENESAVLRTDLRHNVENTERIRAELASSADRAASIRADVEEKENRIAAIIAELASLAEDLSAAERAAEQNAAESAAVGDAVSALTAQENEAAEALARSETESAMLLDRRTDLVTRLETLNAEISEVSEKHRDISEKLKPAEDTLHSAEEKLNEINNVISGHRMRMGGRESRVRELTEQHTALNVERRSAEGRIRMLEEMEKEYEGMGKAVKSVMLSASRGSLHGIHGPVGGLISVDERYAVAVEVALGAAMQNIVVDTQADGKAAIEMLKRTDGGRITVLPLAVMRPAKLDRVPSNAAGFIGIASELVSSRPEYRCMVEQLLGRTVVAESLSDAIKMSETSGHRLRIVTLDGQLINAGGSMTGGSVSKNVGILSRANELTRLRESLDSLTGREQSCAEQLAKAEQDLAAAKYEMETASAELSDAQGAVHAAEQTVGQLKLLRSAARDNLNDLEDEKDALNAQLKETGGRLDAADQDQAGLREKLSSIRAEILSMSEGEDRFLANREAIHQQLSALREKRASLESERQVSEQAAENLRGLIAELSGDDEESLRSVEKLQAEYAAMELRLNEIAAEIESIGTSKREHETELSALTAQKLELEGRRTKNDRLAQEKNRDILELQNSCGKLEQKKISAEMEEKQIVDKLWDGYELSRTAANALRQPVESMSAAQMRVSELRRGINALGNVNVGAIEEYERVSTRYEFLTTQRDDVESAKRDLLKIIADITSEMQGIFLREFHAVDECFRKVFTDLFGGGKASLELEDPEDPLGCGIEIRVQPPGKAVTTISLLSGGEKSFVAIALYFAIMKVRPTPFCVMDEIDAALDEVNVDRYADYMRSMSARTQFIVITHHRATMEEADVLYGVTMQEKGVTTVLTVDLDEAEKSLK